MKFRTLFILLPGIFLLTTAAKLPPVGRSEPHAIVYKTKTDYSSYVAVTLSDDKMAIVSYPSPQDVFTDGKLATPTKLKYGYWLDNRGIMPNTCFIKITYQEYAKMSAAPSPAELYKLIIDKSPFKEIYDLGPRRDFNDTKTINNLIKKHKLKGYKKLL